MKQYNVLVCGTNFGKLYLSALLKGNPDFKLSGILAKGSSRSKAIAEELNVDLYTSIEDVPENIDIACVVVKSTLLGGQGTRISIELLKRGINVIQEHPVYSGDIRQCFKAAEENGCHYHVNSHFIHVKPIKIFIDYIKKTIEQERPLFIDATTSLIYSTIDIIGHALGSLIPFEFNPPVEWSDSSESKIKTGFVPFKCIQGVIGGVPITFKLQNFYDPEDLDSNYLIMHRISIGSESGNTTLLSSHGPVIWTEGFPVPDKKISTVCDRNSLAYHNEQLNGYSKPVSVNFLENQQPVYKNVVGDDWPNAVLTALNFMKKQMETSKVAEYKSPEYLNSLSEIWVEMMKLFGKPVFMKIDELERNIPDPVEFKKRIIKSL